MPVIWRRYAGINNECNDLQRGVHSPNLALVSLLLLLFEPTWLQKKKHRVGT